MAADDQDNIDLYGPDDTDLYGDDDDPAMVEEEVAGVPSATSTPAPSAPATDAISAAAAASLAPLPSIPKKVPSSLPSAVASGSGVSSLPAVPVGGAAPGGGGADDVHMRPSEMPDEGKMFIGGLNWETTDDSLKAYFSQFGLIDHCTIMRDPTGRSRGFAFLTYFEKESVDKVVAQSSHIVDGKVIDPKRAIPHQEHKRASKVFIGGLLASTTTEVVKEYFSQFGTVLDAQVMVDRESARSKGFGFVTFADETGCDKCLAIGMVEIEGKQVEVKRAQPRAGRDGNNHQGGPNNPQNQGMRAGMLPTRPGEYRPQPLANGGGAGAMGGAGMQQMPMGGGGMIGGFPQGGQQQMGGGGMGGGMGMGMDPMMMQQMYQRMLAGGMMQNPQMNMMGGARPQGMMNGAINPSFASPGSGSPINGGAGSPNIRPTMMNPMMGMGMGNMGMGMGGMGNMGMMNPMMGMGMMGMGGGMGGQQGQQQGGVRPMMNMPFNPLLMQQQNPMGAGAGGVGAGLQPTAGAGGARAGGRSPAGAVGGVAGGAAAAAGAGTGPARFNTKGQSHFRPY